jgi:endonuclease-3
MKPTPHLTRVYELLLATYGKPVNEPDFEPLGGLIGTILSQHTSDINAQRTYQQLITVYPTWEAVRDAPTYEVARVIQSGGLANIKSMRIQDVLHSLTEQQQAQGGQRSLAAYLHDELVQRSTEEAWRYLRALPGVGPKTAACVLLFHMARPAFPIDTHVGRLLRRLGVIAPNVSIDSAHTLLGNVLPEKWVYPLHIHLIAHGRQICHAQRPACSACTLYEVCAYVGSVNVQDSALSSRSQQRR